MTDLTVKEAELADAAAMSQILRDILKVWKSARPSSVEHVIAFYVEHPELVRCSVAIDLKGTILGFQSLKKVKDNNEYDLPSGWGVIGTYVDAEATRRGIGKALFASSLDAARKVNLTEIDATIGENNQAGLAYYTAIGFRTYRYLPGAICKKFKVV